MHTIKIRFVSDFNKRDKKEFLSILRERYIVEESSKPDYIFYTVNGYEHLRYDCIRIFYTGECYTPNFNECDYAIAFDHLQFGDRYIRLPLYNFLHYKNNYQQLHNRIPFTREELMKKSGFCNFVVSNCFAYDVRADFFELLSKYKKVDSGGRFKNNIGHLVGDKLTFQNKYKFSIAFENCSYPGYTTEKIVDAFAARTIPIYYGDSDVAKDFNPKTFVNAHDYRSFEEVVERVKEIDNNDDLYLSMMNEPIINPAVDMGDLREFLFSIFDQPLEKAKRRPHSIISASYEQMLRRHRFFEGYIYKYYKKFTNTIYRIKSETIIS